MLPVQVPLALLVAHSQAAIEPVPKLSSLCLDNRQHFDRCEERHHHFQLLLTCHM